MPKWPAKLTLPERLGSPPLKSSLLPSGVILHPAIAMPSSPHTPRRSSRRTANHRCPQCNKAYERPDHLARHLDSRECCGRESIDISETGQIGMSASISVQLVSGVSIVGEHGFSGE